jgi:hypothetical protein
VLLLIDIDTALRKGSRNSIFAPREQSSGLFRSCASRAFPRPAPRSLGGVPPLAKDNRAVGPADFGERANLKCARSCEYGIEFNYGQRVQLNGISIIVPRISDANRFGASMLPAAGAIETVNLLIEVNDHCRFIAPRGARLRNLILDFL